MVYYLTYTGDIITSYDLEKAFFIVTGKDPEKNKKDFWKFRESCFGKSIKETVQASIEVFCRNGHRVQAIKFYKELNNCSFIEAKKFIDDYCKQHKYYPYDFDF